MALLFTDGFDWLDSSLTGNNLGDQVETLYTSPNLSGSSSGAGRLGPGNSLTFGNAGRLITSPALGVQTSGVVGFAVKLDSVPTTTRPVLGVSDSTNDFNLRLELTSGATLRVARTSRFLHSTNFTLTTNQWYYIEFRFENLGGSCSMSVQVDGQLIWSEVDDTLITSWDRFSLGAVSNSMSVDDIYACNLEGANNNDFLGQVNVKLLLPTASGSTNTFTASDGSTAANHYLLVDEQAADGDATYVEGTTSGEREMYEHADSAPLGVVLGVMQSATCRVTDATSRLIRFTTESGATITDNGLANIGNNDYKPAFRTYDQNPVTTTAWTEANLDATDFGITID